MKPFVFFGTFFFVCGAYFCYRVVFPIGFGFFIDEYASVSIEPFLKVSEYLSFTSRMLLAFGVMFELPVFTFFLARIGIVDHKMMIGDWRYADGRHLHRRRRADAGTRRRLADADGRLRCSCSTSASIGVAYAFGRPARGATDSPADERPSARG